MSPAKFRTWFPLAAGFLGALVGVAHLAAGDDPGFAAVIGAVCAAMGFAAAIAIITLFPEP